MNILDLEELQEALEDILPSGFKIETDKNGQLVIYTGLSEDEDGGLVDFDSDEDEDDSELDSEFDPLFDQLADED